MIAALGPSVHDVVPGSADLLAGSTVTVMGSNFLPDTRVRFKAVALSEVRYVDSTRIEVVLAAPVRMHGMAIKVENPDGTRTVYYLHQRTQREYVSADTTLRDAVPVFPRGSRTRATVDVGGIRTGLELSEVFGIPYPAAASVRMSATAPIQMMGIALDEAGAATPIAAR